MMSMPTSMLPFASMVVRVVPARSFDLQIPYVAYSIPLEIGSIPSSSPQAYVCRFYANNNSMKLV